MKHQPLLLALAAFTAFYAKADDTGGSSSKETPPKETPPSPPKKKGPPTIKVRVVGTQPLLEDGELRQPARKEPDGKGGLKPVAADIFEITEERAEALGDLVEVVK